MTDEKKKKVGPRELPEGYEYRGHRLKLYPTFEQVERLVAMQDEMRRAWNLLAGWRRAHLDACVVRAERDGIVGPEPPKPDKQLREDASDDNRAAWKAYLEAMGARRKQALDYAIKNVAGYGFMRLGTNAWDYGALRDFVKGDGESVCSAHQYQALIKNFIKAKRPRPRKKNEPAPLQVMSGQCYLREPPKDATNERSRRIADATIVFSGMRIRAREPFRRSRAERRPDKGLRFPDAPVLEGVAIRRETDGWYAAVRLMVPKRPPAPWVVDDVVGVAVGLDVLCATSSGRLFKNVRRAETTKLIAEMQAGAALDAERAGVEAIEDERVGSVWKYPDGRQHFISTTSARLQTQLSRRVRQLIESEILPYLQRYRVIVIAPTDDDDVQRMAQGRQARLTPNDRGGYVSAMGQLLAKIRQLGPERVREVSWVDRARTCSRCGFVDVTSWRWRERPTGSCVSCGYTEHRKINTARNVRAKGLELLKEEGYSFDGCTEPQKP